MLNLKISSRSVVITKSHGGKFHAHKNNSDNLRQNNNQKTNDYISKATKTKILNCVLTYAETKLQAEKTNCAEHSAGASVQEKCTPAPAPLRSAQFENNHLAYFTTLTTLRGTTEQQAKKYLNIYLTQLRRQTDIYLWTVEKSSGGIIHFHLLTFEQPMPNWKNITRNYYKHASHTAPVLSLQNLEKTAKYMLKDSTKQGIQNRKHGMSRALGLFRQIKIQIEEDKIPKAIHKIMKKEEYFIIATPSNLIVTYLQTYYNLIYFNKRSVIQTNQHLNNILKLIQ